MLGQDGKRVGRLKTSLRRKKTSKRKSVTGKERSPSAGDSMMQVLREKRRTLGAQGLAALGKGD